MKRLYPLESAEHKALITWSKLNPITADYLITNENGGYRNKREAYNLKQRGIKPGVPDLFLAYPHKGKHGLWIELKRQRACNPKVSAPQRDWLYKMKALNYGAEVAYGWEEAAKVIEDYLS